MSKLPILYIFILLLISVNLQAQEIEDEVDAVGTGEALWVQIPEFKQLDELANEQVRKRVMMVTTRQSEYELILPDSEVIRRIEKLKKSIKIVKLNIKKSENGNFDVEASLIDKKGEKLLRRSRRRFVPEEDLFITVERAVALLFGDPPPKEKEEKNNKQARIAEKNAPPLQDKAAIDFRDRVASLKDQIATKFQQIKKEVAENKLNASGDDPNKKEAKKDNVAGENSLVAQAQEEQLAAQNPLGVFAPRNAVMAQLGLMAQNYDIIENAKTNEEVNIRTNIQHLFLQAETMRQIFKERELDWLLGLKFGYPLSKAEVPVKKYIGITAGVHYTIGRYSLFPIGVGAFLTKDNLSFANVPRRGEGLKTADVGAIWNGFMLSIGAWEKRIALRLSMQSLMSASLEEDNINNTEFTASRLEANFVMDTSWLLNNTLTSVKYQLTSFESAGTRELTGDDASFVLSIGYLF